MNPQKTQDKRHSAPATPVPVSISRKASGRIFLISALCLLLILTGVDRFLHRQSRLQAADAARAYAEFLANVPATGFLTAAQNMASTFPAIGAVALMSSSGTVDVALPDAGQVQSILAGGVPTPGESCEVTAELEAQRGTFAVHSQVITTQNDGNKLALVAVRSASTRTTWTIIAAWVVALGLVAAAIIASGLTKLLDQHVDEPIDALVRAVQAATDGIEPLRVWRESARSSTVSIDSRLATLCDVVLSREDQSRRLERDAARRLRDHELGLTRRLRRAEDRAMTDALTGLKNRAFVTTELEAIVDRQRKNGNDLAVVMIDVDNFKKLNDTLGHTAGDEMLRFIGDLLRGAIRPSDYAIRYGGDEFVLLLLDANADQALSIVERIIKMFGQYAASSGPTRMVSLSAGVATLTTAPQKNARDLLAAADVALYTAKRGGKRSVAVGAA